MWSSRKSFILIFLLVLTLSLTTISATTQSDLWDSAVSIWHFNGDATDAKGLNNGTNNGAIDTTGKLNGAYNFNGTTDFIEIPGLYGSSSDMTQAFSLSVWIKRSETGPVQTIWSKARASPNTGDKVWRLASDNLDLAIFNKGTASGSASLDTDWHHVVLVHDGSNNYQFYYDGSTDAGSQTIPIGLDVSTAIWNIGKYGSSSFWNGTLDEFIYFNKSISQTEIDYLYNSGTGTELTEDTGPTPYSGSGVTEFGYNNLNLGTLTRKVTVINYTQKNVNSSSFWNTGDRGPLGNVVEILTGWLTDDNTYVTTTGDNMTGDLEFQDAAIQNPNYIQFNTTFVDGQSEGRLQWNSDDGTLEVGLPGGNVNLQIGEEVLFRATNDAGQQIDNCQPVYISGATGSFPDINISGTDLPFRTAQATIGLATENIADGQKGFVNTYGFVRDCDTSDFAEGSQVFLGPYGNFSAFPPAAPGASVFIGIVTRSHATDGIIFVQLDKQALLSDLSDVSSTGLNNNTILIYNNVTGVWNPVDSSSISSEGYWNYTDGTYGGILHPSAGNNNTVYLGPYQGGVNQRTPPIHIQETWLGNGIARPAILIDQNNSNSEMAIGFEFPANADGNTMGWLGFNQDDRAFQFGFSPNRYISGGTVQINNEGIGAGIASGGPLAHFHAQTSSGSEETLLLIKHLTGGPGKLMNIKFLNGGSGATLIQQERTNLQRSGDAVLRIKKAVYPNSAATMYTVQDWDENGTSNMYYGATVADTLDVDGKITTTGDQAITGEYTPYTYADVIVQNGYSSGLNIFSDNATGTGFIYFGDQQSYNPGAISYSHTTNDMTFRANGVTKMTLPATGNVELNGLHIEGSQGATGGSFDPYAYLTMDNDYRNGINVLSNNAYYSYISFGDDADYDRGRIMYDNPTDSMVFDTSDVEAMRIDSVGNINMTDDLNVAGDITAENLRFETQPGKIISSSGVSMLEDRNGVTMYFNDLNGHAQMVFEQGVDLTANDVFNFRPSGNGVEMTDANGRQAFMSLRADVKQTGTAAVDGLYVNVVNDSFGDGSTGDGNNILNLARDYISRFRVDVDGNVFANGSLEVTGNWTGNSYYAEGYGVDIGEVEIASSGVYYNISNFTMGESNGVDFDAYGGVTPQISGLYHITGSWAFSGTPNNEYHLGVALNGAMQDKCHTERVIGSGGDVGSASITCFLRIANTEIVNAQIENVDSAGNPTIHNVNFNMVRIGD